MNSTNVYSPDTAILQWAVEFGCENQILRLLEEDKADLTATNENGDTVLHLIFRNKKFAEKDIANFLKIFLERGVDPNRENKHEQTVLHVAVAKRMKSIVEVLRSSGADVKKSDTKGNSTAHLFVEDEKNNFFELSRLGRSNKLEEMEDESANFVEWLIEKGFDFDHENKDKKSALDLTVDYNLQHILVVLLKHTRLVNFDDRQNKSLLHLFLEKNYNSKNSNYAYTSLYATRIVKLFLEKGASAVAFDKFNETPLRMAVEKQDTNIIETMIDHHLESCDDNTATIMFAELMKSCASWVESKIEYFLRVLGELVAKGADVNTKDKSEMTPLFHAFHCRNRRAAGFLADRGADFSVISDKGENLYHALAKNDPRVNYDNPTLYALFDLVANQNCLDSKAKNRDDETPLHLAAKTGNFAIVQKLIDHGVEVDCKNKYKQTPLHLAVQQNQSEELVIFLIVCGADVNSKDHQGYRPLLRAVESPRDHNPLVPTLLKWGAHVNACSGHLSAFATAIKFGYSSNAKEMLAYGADINEESVVDLLRNLSPEERSLKAGFVLQHWLKLQVARLPCAEGYETFVEYNPNRPENFEVFNAYLKEIHMLKYTTYIVGLISIYNCLHMAVGRRAVYTPRENVKILMERPRLERRFPQYKDVILAAYREAILWKSLLKPARRALLRFIDVWLPQECCELIFAYLGNQDLMNIIECDEDV